MSSLFFGQNMDRGGLAEDEIQMGSQIWKNANLAIDDAGAGIYHANDDALNDADYGLLYTLAAANRIVATIAGWRLPTEAELQALNSTIIITDVGHKMREVGIDHWLSPNSGATNSTGFTGRGSGYFDLGANDYFYFKNKLYFWTATETDANYQKVGSIAYDTSYLQIANFMNKTDACSIRLIKDV